MKISSFFRLAASAALAFFLVGCAHPIAIQAEKSPPRVESQLSSKKVAYVMNDTDRGKQVTTAGGGGDKVSYSPYRDMEKAIRDALRAVYTDVIVVPDVKDGALIRNAGIDLVFVPEITTTSSSSSPVTWPPTQFSTEISCKVTNADGVEIDRLRVTGNGYADYEEFKSNFGLAANRAGTDVAAKLSREIADRPKLR